MEQDGKAQQDRIGQDRKIRFLCRVLDVHLIYFSIPSPLSFNYLLLFYSRKYSQNVLHIRRKRHNECCGLRKIPRNYQSSSAYDSLQLDSLLTNERRTIQMVTHSIIAVRPLKNNLTFLRRRCVQIHQKVLVCTAKYRRKKSSINIQRGKNSCFCIIHRGLFNSPTSLHSINPVIQFS